MKTTRAKRIEPQSMLTLAQYHASVIALLQALPSMLHPHIVCEAWGRGYLAACHNIEAALERLRQKL